MSLLREQLVGCWRKRESSEGSRFPDKVQFFADGTYRASSVGRRSNWDEASFDVLTGGQLRMQTATDRKVTYRADVSQERLTVQDGQAHATYERSDESG
jgi:hypothetical protein